MKRALEKIGGIPADNADVGCGSVLNPGTDNLSTGIGRNTSVYPITAHRDVYPENCVVKSADCISKRK